MTDIDSPPENAPLDARRKLRKQCLSVALFVVGVMLLGAAVYTVTTRRETLDSAWAAARGASPALIVACVLLPTLNWLTAAATIWVLTGRFGKVRLGEMTALVGAAWLLNLLPMRPGMVGRVAYHKRYNGIRVRDSVRVLMMSVICTGAALGMLLAGVMLAGAVAGGNDATGRSVGAVALLLAGPPLAIGATALVIRRRGGHVWRWPAAVAFRYVDMATWCVRYALVFMLIGRPIGILNAGAITAVSQVAMFVPVQLGLREWAVGAASTALPAGATAAEPLADAAATGLLADCVMRAAELLIVLPVGLTASVWLWRRMRTPTAAPPMSMRSGVSSHGDVKSGMTDAEQRIDGII